MISICKPCKCSFVLATVKEALPLSVHEMTTLLSGRVFSINFFRSSNLPSTTLDGSLIVLLVPTCNIRAFFQQWVDIIVHVIDCSSREVFNFDLFPFFLLFTQCQTTLNHQLLLWHFYSILEAFHSIR